MDMNRDEKTQRRVKRIVENLPSEINYLISFTYSMPFLSKDKITKLTSRHQKRKKDYLLSGRIIEPAIYDEDFDVVTFFEVFDKTREKINLPLYPGATIKVQKLKKWELFIEITPLPSGSEDMPFLIFGVDHM